MRGLCLLLGFIFIPLTCWADEPKKQSIPIVGNWLGTLNVGAIELRLGFRIQQDAAGKLTATMDSFDQGAKDLPAKEITFEKNKLVIKLPQLGITYTGELQADTDTIKGEFQQLQKLPLDLKRVTQFPTVARPQHPKKPYPYEEIEVTFPSKAANVTLAGTLTKPNGAGPFPTMVLISGSGPQDRDETLLGHKPFWVIADYLTRRGIAVLRFDDRGIGKSTGKHDTATSNDFADDVAGAVTLLKSRPDVSKIGLIGHSEGGLIAPIVAVQQPDVSMIVLLAGPGLPGDEILLSQGEALLKILKAENKDREELKAFQRKAFDMVKRDLEDKTITKEMQEYINQLPETKRKEIEAQGGISSLKQITTPWFRTFLKYDPRPTLERLKCPVLAINGELDFQVVPKENLAAIEKALKAGKNADFTIKELPKLNHLFQTAKTGGISEYGQIEETFAPTALELITEWILKRAK